MERRTGKMRGAFSRMHRVLDGWMLARAPASTAQGLHYHGPRCFNSPSLCKMCGLFFFFFFFFNLTFIADGSCLWTQRIFPSLPGSRLTMFLSRCKFSTITTRQPMVEFYLLTFPRFPLRKKEHKSYFGKNRTHDFRTSRCEAYLLNHSGDEQRFCICSL